MIRKQSTYITFMKEGQTLNLKNERNTKKKKKNRKKNTFFSKLQIRYTYITRKIRTGNFPLVVNHRIFLWKMGL